MGLQNWMIDELCDIQEQEEYHKDIIDNMRRYMDDICGVLVSLDISPEYVKKTKYMISFLKTECDEVLGEIRFFVQYNTLPLLAYNLASNEMLHQDILKIYHEYEKIIDEVILSCKVLNTWCMDIIQEKHVEIYKIVVGLLEASMLTEEELNTPEHMREQAFSCFGDYKIIYSDWKQEDKKMKLARTEMGWIKTHNVEIDKNICEHLNKEMVRLVKKGNNKIDRCIKRLGENETFDVESHTKTFLHNLYKKGKNKTMMQLVGEVAAINMLICYYGKTLTNSMKEISFYGNALNYLLTEFSVYQNESITLNGERRNHYKAIETLADEITLDGSPFCYLFSQQKVHVDKFISACEMSPEDIKKIIECYEAYSDEWDMEEIALPLIYMTIILKNYKQLEELYYNTLDSTLKKKLEQNMQLLKKKELAEQKARSDAEELKRLYEEKLQILEKENKRLLEENEKQKKELERNRNINQQNKANEKELNSLREYVYMQGMRNSTDEIKENEQEQNMKFEKLKALNVIVVGGHSSWNNKMKGIFPKWKYVAAEAKGISEQIFDKADIVLCFDTYCSHAMYYKIMAAVEKGNTQIGYIGSAVNIERTINNIISIAEQKELII